MSSTTGNHDNDSERTAAVAAGSTNAPREPDTARFGVQDLQRVLDAEKAKFGRIKFFTAFFGWLTATGGRMARFSGLKQGLAVWLWLLVITVLVAVVGAIVGSNFNVFAQLGSIPNLGNLTGTGALAAIAAAIVALIGALLGGLAGMHYHRKVDKAGLGA